MDTLGTELLETIALNFSLKYSRYLSRFNDSNTQNEEYVNVSCNNGEIISALSCLQASAYFSTISIFVILNNFISLLLLWHSE